MFFTILGLVVTVLIGCVFLFAAWLIYVFDKDFKRMIVSSGKIFCFTAIGLLFIWAAIHNSPVHLVFK